MKSSIHRNEMYIRLVESSAAVRINLLRNRLLKEWNLLNVDDVNVYGTHFLILSIIFLVFSPHFIPLFTRSK